MNFKFKTNHKKILADTTTPVSIYLRLRDTFPNSLLLESSEYHSRDNNISYICCQPIASIILENEELSISLPNQKKTVKNAKDLNLREEVSNFRKSFEADAIPDVNVISNGLFGYFSFEAVEFYEDIELTAKENNRRKIPTLQYHIYKYVIAIDHFRNQLHVFENLLENEPSDLDRLQFLIQNKNFPEYTFQVKGEESSNMKDEDFKALVNKMKEHIQRGDVFQIVPSRAFETPFSGDEFNVYRALRSINPSPYLFYFDYGDFKLFGSSPEAQLTIKNDQATIYPIAGTFKRTGNMDLDEKIAEELKNDPKESAEHVMLVDLARNDLSRHCHHVKVKSYKEAQYYSHVIHLVSKVSGTLNPNTNPFDVVGDTFPAGTLSGAPKHMAITLIDRYEGLQRSFYSGAIGFMGFNGDFNHAIMIRSFLSKQNVLHYQAGAGIVLDSDPEKELQEVNNKISALRRALELAETL
ncbi:anthranilate synthase component I [Sphingobacterium mizutaii NBRC 14946 = DSM 11724]|uniref:Anthranilate synthase component 1 n=2 Tax=Sphingobacterium mizutaii TaxID=1010 RepID=A0AAJ4XG80_9SPHI|nr:anthranilate synthase component I family protein [Sphingobacterium mizutaii]GEM68258.1 anthranilate synthase component I [Sphingobacterium mizutaii NBRC 14946 = DSM 11724]SDL80644.1 anthranilate synthase component 1 [Sphingobacterium mizutaii]SNV59420.1 Anthranilate synthase component 1 [Sphingobacterium mizutaii]